MWTWLSSSISNRKCKLKKRAVTKGERRSNWFRREKIPSWTRWGGRNWIVYVPVQFRGLIQCTRLSMRDSFQPLIAGIESRCDPFKSRADKRVYRPLSALWLSLWKFGWINSSGPTLCSFLPCGRSTVIGCTKVHTLCLAVAIGGLSQQRLKPKSIYEGRKEGESGEKKSKLRLTCVD